MRLKFPKFTLSKKLGSSNKVEEINNGIVKFDICEQKENIIQDEYTSKLLFLPEYRVASNMFKYTMENNIIIQSNCTKNKGDSNKKEKKSRYSNIPKKVVNSLSGNSEVDDRLSSSRCKSTKIEIPIKLKMVGSSLALTPRRLLSSLSPKFSRQSTLITTPRILSTNQEIKDAFPQVKLIMDSKCKEFIDILYKTDLWEDNGYKNGIRLQRKVSDKNYMDYSVIRGIIEIDLDKENELSNKRGLPSLYNLCDIITPSDFINYIWSVDPLSYDNTIEKSYRIHTWEDDYPGYCVYYHAYKGSMGVQSRDFVLLGHKSIVDTGCTNKLSDSSENTPTTASTFYSPKSIITPFLSLKVSVLQSSVHTPTSCKSLRSLSIFREKSHIYSPAIFIATDLNDILKQDTNVTTHRVRAKCIMNGILAEMTRNKNNKSIMTINVIWIGDLKGKLPEFLKKALLSMSISILKVLKDQYLQMKRKQLKSILGDIR
ncbi:hypothetical protein cand_013120 [Cryptosporidium andersoni]|uniref:START domain-containing protein n=1 Tax=Cryptosporidium andersoni TaxID=117008 RepID=A0A1J4MDN6_9CRYT|nr:hypothetical protein cand_013120 [Cryptosporidium andersoni]